MSRRGRDTSDQRRLLHVFPSFEIGGAQARFARLAAGLGEAFRHTVISLSGRDDAVALLGRDAPVDLATTPSAGGGIPGRLGRYRRLLVEQRPDVLVTYNWGAIEFALSNLALGVRHIHIEDGFGPDEAKRQFRRRIWGRRLALAHAEVVVPSLTLHRIAREVWRMPPRRLHHIPNGVADGPPAALTDESLSVGQDVQVIWVGALREEKNPLRLLRAFASAPPAAHLLIVGEGPERGAMVAEAQRLGLGERCRFLGRRADARDLMRQCDILALSSDTEQMPLVVLEAMEAGLPIASTDVGDVAHMVAPANRLFVRGRSYRDLASSIAGLAADAELRARIGRANRLKVQECYREVDMVETYRRLFSAAEAPARSAAAPSDSLITTQGAGLA
ncbi:MAG TPA: glycosyltransferase [Caulobacteraceae bacterium]|nr:glycosyltransferase [Caulobacteraceae bacterium]